MKSFSKNSLLCVYAFDVLISYLRKEKLQKNVFPEYFKNEKYPLFVTWTKGKNKELRGCVGTFKSDDLEKNLTKYAIIAATKDDRFDPIKENEITDLNCSISLLINFQKGNNCLDWELGKHGIQIDIDGYTATYLPEVPIEHEMSKKEAIEGLLQKAGYGGGFKYVKNKIKLTKFETIKVQMSYDEYMEFKKIFK